MSLGRRKVSVDDPSRWVFNRMADAYAARPPYPTALLDRLASIARRGRIADIGAGTGLIAIPLANRGQNVVAIEPAAAMLAAIAQSGRAIETHRAAAESMPIADASIDLAILADAIHFLDAERTGRELARVLEDDGALAIVTIELADTPFMNAVSAAMEDASPRRPRETSGILREIGALAGVKWSAPERFDDATEIDRATLERVFRSISFVGGAMNDARFETFMRNVLTAGDRFGIVWARRITLHVGRK